MPAGTSTWSLEGEEAIDDAEMVVAGPAARVGGKRKTKNKGRAVKQPRLGNGDAKRFAARHRGGRGGAQDASCDDEELLDT